MSHTDYKDRKSSQVWWRCRLFSCFTRWMWWWQMFIKKEHLLWITFPRSYTVWKPGLRWKLQQILWACRHLQSAATYGFPKEGRGGAFLCHTLTTLPRCGWNPDSKFISRWQDNGDASSQGSLPLHRWDSSGAVTPEQFIHLKQTSNNKSKMQLPKIFSTELQRSRRDFVFAFSHSGDPS